MASQESTIGAAPENLHEIPALPNDDFRRILTNNNPMKLADLEDYQLLNFALFVHKNAPPFKWDELREIFLDQDDDEIIPSENVPDTKLEGFYAELLEEAKKLPDIDIETITDAELAQAYYCEVNEQLLSQEWAEWNADMPFLNNLEMIDSQYKRYFETDVIDEKEKIVSNIFEAISSTYLPEEVQVERSTVGEKVPKKIIRVSASTPAQPAKNGLTEKDPIINMHATVRNIVRELQADLIKTKQAQSLNLSEQDRHIVTSTDETEEQRQQTSAMHATTSSIAMQHAAAANAAAQQAVAESLSAAAEDGDSNASIDGSFEAEDEDVDEANKTTIDLRTSQNAAKQSESQTTDAEPDHMLVIPAEYAVGGPSASGHVTDAPEALEFAVDMQIPPAAPAHAAAASPAKSRSVSAASSARGKDSFADMSTQPPTVVDNRKRTRASRSVSPIKKPLDSVAEEENLRESSLIDENSIDSTASTASYSSSQQDRQQRNASEEANAAPSPVIAAKHQTRSSFVSPNAVLPSSSSAVSTGGTASSSRHTSQSPVRLPSKQSTMRTRSSLQHQQKQIEPAPSPAHALRLPSGNAEAASAATGEAKDTEAFEAAIEIPATPKTLISEAGTPVSSPSRTVSRSSRRSQQQQQQRKTTPAYEPANIEDDAEAIQQRVEHQQDAGTPLAAASAHEDEENDHKAVDDVDSAADAEDADDAVPEEAAVVDSVNSTPLVRPKPPKPYVKAAGRRQLLTYEERMSGRQLRPSTTARIIFEQQITAAPAFLAHFDEVRKTEARDYQFHVKMPICGRDILKHTLQQPQRPITTDKAPYVPLHLAPNLLYANCVSYNEATRGLGKAAGQMLGRTRDELTGLYVSNRLMSKFFERQRDVRKQQADTSQPPVENDAAETKQEEIET